MKRIYVAGAISRGDQFRNVAAGIEAGERLLGAGYAPYVPHLNYVWHMLYPHTHKEWCEMDFAWLATCDALVRLPGKSEGAAAEVRKAYDLDIPVFYGVDAFFNDPDPFGRVIV